MRKSPGWKEGDFLFLVIYTSVLSHLKSKQIKLTGKTNTQRNSTIINRKPFDL
jgi:hypothetical protein